MITIGQTTYPEPINAHIELLKLSRRDLAAFAAIYKKATKKNLSYEEPNRTGGSDFIGADPFTKQGLDEFVNEIVATCFPNVQR